MKNSNLEVYNTHSVGLAYKFNKSGVRSQDIKNAFDYFDGIKNPSVLEIGCGNGRDAKEILKYTPNYLGIDYSSGMLDLAREYIPEANFQNISIEGFDTSEKFDIIFAFAALVHLPKDQMKIVLNKISWLLKAGGIFHLSLKYSPNYEEKNIEDEFGIRFFACYNGENIREIATDYDIEKEQVNEVNKRFWLDMVLRKKN